VSKLSRSVASNLTGFQVGDRVKYVRPSRYGHVQGVDDDMFGMRGKIVAPDTEYEWLVYFPALKRKGKGHKGRGRAICGHWYCDASSIVLI